MKGFTRSRQLTVALFTTGIICGYIIAKIFQLNDKYDEHEAGFKVNNYDNDAVAKLEGKVRILCFILTGPKSYRPQNIMLIKETWGKRCDTLLFMASYSDDKVPTVALPSPEGYRFLWNKTKESFKYVYENYEGQYDWVLKADDDTYTIMENLRFLLKDTNPREPIVFGDFHYMFKNISKHDFKFVWGGPGYVLSREAVRRFVNEGVIGGACSNITKIAEDIGVGRVLSPETICKYIGEGIIGEACGNTTTVVEDVGMNMCVNKIGVKNGESRDDEQRSRYYASVKSDTFATGSGETFKLDFNRYSDTPIGFHHRSADDIVLMELLLYHVRVKVPSSGYP